MRPKMIEAGLEYESGALDKILLAFASLPIGLKPVYFASEEKDVGGRASLIEDQKKFSAFIKTNKAGFFLRGPGLTYSISLAGSKPIICDCFLEVEPVMMPKFFVGMAKANPVFGFACALEEREWRNRIIVKIGINTIETWVGRDTKKYIPGLYWLTLIPDRLAKLHNISTAEICKAARENTILDGNQFLFQFYQNPKDWLADKSKMGILCASTPGIFSVEKIRLAAMAATTYAELQAVLACAGA
jgi:hypothetical protein